jgi:hypothetical protein
MNGNFEVIDDSHIEEEIETMRILDDLFTKVRIIGGIVGMVGLLIAIVLLLK